MLVFERPIENNTSALVALAFFIQHKLIDAFQRGLLEDGLDPATARLEAFEHYMGLPGWQELLVGVGLTTLGWIVVAFLSKPSDEKTLVQFVSRINPGGPGWKPILQKAREMGNEISTRQQKLPKAVISMLLGCMAVYAALFGIGYWLLGNTLGAIVFVLVSLIAAMILLQLRKTQVF